jgi:Subtilisin inhibitor-like
MRSRAAYSFGEVRRPLLAAAVLVLAVPCASPAAAPETRLQVTVWPKGPERTPMPRTWTLRCDPVGGSLPKRRAACRTLARLERPFAPVRRGALCGALYGGPAVALVRGTFRGRRVWTRFRRDNLCQINRWDRVQLLFPVPL